ncbi:MAG: phytanoyl-CoA dioxygenase family protein [Bacteroidetes bacterium]|nr:phytanoyl-CoA dioxygenase family protein [Bacteroidota bacterium]
MSFMISITTTNLNNMNKVRQIFKDKALDKQLWENGFVTMPVLNEDEIRRCYELYERTDNKTEEITKCKKEYSEIRLNTSDERYNTFEINDESHRKEIFNELKSSVGEKVIKPFHDYRVLGMNLVVKKAGENNVFAVHHEDMHVDEGFHTAVNVWVPLQDVSKENGTLYILKNSHKLPKPNIRGIGLPFHYQYLWEKMEPKCEFVTLKAGHGLYFLPTLIHGSYGNFSNKDRVVALTSAVPKEAEAVVYMRYEGLPENKVEKFRCPSEFFLRARINKKPEGFESLGFFDYIPNEISEEEFFSYLV